MLHLWYIYNYLVHGCVGQLFSFLEYLGAGDFFSRLKTAIPACHVPTSTLVSPAPMVHIGHDRSKRGLRTGFLGERNIARTVVECPFAPPFP